jgi:hypothetical protein
MRVSADYTFAAKVVAPIFDLFVFVLSLAVGGLNPAPFMFVVGLVVIQAPIWRAKEVVAHDDGLRVRGLRSQAVIPYADIREVRASHWRTGVVHVLLRPESAFPSPIVFLPPWGYARPAVDALRQRLARPGH